MTDKEQTMLIIIVSIVAFFGGMITSEIARSETKVRCEKCGNILKITDYKIYSKGEGK